MQYANNSNLLLYLDQNNSKLTWKKKLQLAKDIAWYLHSIHGAGLVHCDLHGENIVMHDHNFPGPTTQAFICGLGLSQSVNSYKRNSIIQGVLPFIAPEVFNTRKFTQKSDIYSFGIIMHLIATGKPPFEHSQFDGDSISNVMGGLRPLMPDSAPEEYKKFAMSCCDTDPDKRPDADTLWHDMCELLRSWAERQF